jgi:hypothetical protein
MKTLGRIRAGQTLFLTLSVFETSLLIEGAVLNVSLLQNRNG